MAKLNKCKCKNVNVNSSSYDKTLTHCHDEQQLLPDQKEMPWGSHPYEKDKIQEY